MACHQTTVLPQEQDVIPTYGPIQMVQSLRAGQTISGSAIGTIGRSIARATNHTGRTNEVTASTVDAGCRDTRAVEDVAIHQVVAEVTAEPVAEVEVLEVLIAGVLTAVVADAVATAMVDDVVAAGVKERLESLLVNQVNQWMTCRVGIIAWS